MENLLTEPKTTPINTNVPLNLETPASDPGSAKKLKRYRCCYCDRAFSRSEHRSRHERSHTKERPFHCDKCPSTFVRRDLLLRHDRTVHAAKTNKGSSGDVLKTTTSKTGAKSKTPPTSTEITPVQSPAPPTPESITTPPTEMPETAKIMTDTYSDTRGSKSSGLDGLENNWSKLETTTKSRKRKANSDQMSLKSTSASKTHSKQVNKVNKASKANKDSLSSSSSSAQFHSKSSPSHDPLVTLALASMDPCSVNNAADINAALLITELYQSFRNHQPNNPKHQVNNLEHQSNINTSTNTNPNPNPNPNKQHIVIPQISSSFPSSILAHHFSHQTNHILSRTLLNRYIATYFLRFHPHLPFLHIKSFDPATVGPALLFGVCSIGALLCGDAQAAHILQSKSQHIVAHTSAASSIPLDVLQTLLISIVYATWSDNAADLEFAISVQPLLLAELENAVSRQPGVFADDDSRASFTWQSFIQTEQVIRAYFGAFIALNSLSQISSQHSSLSHSIFFAASIPHDLLLPCSEHVWNSVDSNSSLSTQKLPPKVSYGQALEVLRYENEKSWNSLKLSSMAVYILSTSLLSNVCEMDWLNSDNSHDAERQSKDRQLLAAMFDFLLKSISKHSLSTENKFEGLDHCHSSFAISIVSSIDTSFLTQRPSTLIDLLHQQPHPLILNSYFSLIRCRITLLFGAFSVHQKPSNSHQLPKDLAYTLIKFMGHLLPHHKFSGPTVRSLILKCSELLRITMVAGPQLLDNLSLELVNCPEVLEFYFETVVLAVMWCFQYEIEYQNKSPKSQTTNITTHLHQHYHASGTGDRRVYINDQENKEHDPESDEEVYQLFQRVITETGISQTKGCVSLNLAAFASEVFSHFSTSGLSHFLSQTLKLFSAYLESDLHHYHAHPASQPHHHAPTSSSSPPRSSFSHSSTSSFSSNTTTAPDYNLHYSPDAEHTRHIKNVGSEMPNNRASDLDQSVYPKSYNFVSTETSTTANNYIQSASEKSEVSISRPNLMNSPNQADSFTNDNTRYSNRDRHGNSSQYGNLRYDNNDNYTEIGGSRRRSSGSKTQYGDSPILPIPKILSPNNNRFTNKHHHNTDEYSHQYENQHQNRSWHQSQNHYQQRLPDLRSILGDKIGSPSRHTR